MIEKAVWNMEPIPIHQTYTALNNGGIILCAYDHDQMIGYSYSFAGFNNNQSYLCSHMLGILPDYRQKGLGERLKLKQAEIARKMGYSKITWTYDPLESRNAYVNLHKLRAIGAHYKENHYGQLNDNLNQGLPTDRIVIEWPLQKKQKEFINQKNSENDYSSSNKDRQLIMVTLEQPRISKNFNRNLIEENSWFVPIPNHFQKIKKQNIELAKKWRFTIRQVFLKLFSDGFIATDFIFNKQSNYSLYVFTKDFRRKQNELIDSRN